jgi:hypothetical protein
MKVPTSVPLGTSRHDPVGFGGYFVIGINLNLFIPEGVCANKNLRGIYYSIYIYIQENE